MPDNPLQPAFVLVEPQLGENIGAAARAMLNCGLADMRLVRPRDGWPNPKAGPSSAGADRVLTAARVFAETADAIAEMEFVLATSARRRDMVKPVLTPRAAAVELHRRLSDGQRCAVLFGPERTGLVNEDVMQADALLTAPLNPDFASLNLAQAVLMVAYEFHTAGDETDAYQLPMGRSRPATRAETDNLIAHLIEELDRSRFFATPDMRPVMVANITNALMRMGATEQELRTLHGAIVALCGRPRQRAADGNLDSGSLDSGTPSA